MVRLVSPVLANHPSIPIMPKPSILPGSKVKVKIKGEIVEATYVEWSEKWDTAVVNYQGKNSYRKIYSEQASSSDAAPASAESAPAPVGDVLDVNTRFEFIDRMTVMVAKGPINAFIVTGPGGLGKTYSVTDTLTRCGMVADRDYVYRKGFSTPKALYRTLFENKDKTIVFDDCDAVLDHKTSLDILKGALDSYDVRKVSWNKEGGSADDLPADFEFAGKIIFISNRKLANIDQAILSRSIYVDVFMTSVEKITRIRAISHGMKRELSPELKKEVIDFLDELKDVCRDLNIRTFLKICDIRVHNASNWRLMAKYIVTS